MDGHSKWANIKHRKEKSDAKKGKIFSKIGREIMVAVKAGGPDPEINSKLKDVIAKAKANNVPNDTIQRSIKKASGDIDSVNYEEITYEGYGPEGIAMIVEAMTDNKNRTAGEMRHLFDKYGGNLGATGCVSWMFERKGLIVIEKSESIDEEQLMMDVIEAGAEDFSVEDGYYEVLTKPEDFSKVRDYLEGKNYNFASAELEMIPTTYNKIDDEKAEKVKKLIDILEENDDVQKVYTNME